MTKTWNVYELLSDPNWQPPTTARSLRTRSTFPQLAPVTGEKLLGTVEADDIMGAFREARKAFVGKRTSVRRKVPD